MYTVHCPVTPHFDLTTSTNTGFKHIVFQHLVAMFIASLLAQCIMYKAAGKWSSFAIGFFFLQLCSKKRDFTMSVFFPKEKNSKSVVVPLSCVSLECKYMSVLKDIWCTLVHTGQSDQCFSLPYLIVTLTFRMTFLMFIYIFRNIQTLVFLAVLLFYLISGTANMQSLHKKKL